MLEHERITYEPCGCRTDTPTGLVVHYCHDHDPRNGKTECPECHHRITLRGGVLVSHGPGRVFILCPGSNRRVR